MWKVIANFILRNRFFVLGVITLATVFFGFYAFTGLRIDNKYGIVLPKNSQTTENYLKFKDLFGEDGGALIIAIETDTLYTEKSFLRWKQLGDSILQMEGVESVISEATLFTIKNNQAASKFEIFRVFSDITYREKSIDSIRKEVKAKPIFKGLLYNEKGNVSLMMVTINEDFLTSKSKSQVVVNIENLAKTYQTKIGKIHFGGLPHLRVEISNRIMFEMLLFIGLSMLVTSSLLYFFFRSFRVVIMCGIIVAVTVVWAMGEIAVMDFKLTILMALIPPLMIVIGIPNCIFLMTKFHQEVKEHGNKVKALSNVIQKTGTATFLTNFTIAIGFGTFAFTNSEKLMAFGMVASFNIMMVFVLTMCLMPIYISFLDAPEQRHLKHLDRKFAIAMVRYIVHIVQRRRTLIYVLTTLVIIVSVLGFSKIKTTGNLTSDLPKNDTILQDVKFMEKNFGGSIPFEIMVSYKERGRLFKGSTMERVEEVQEMFAQDSLFSKTISPIDFVKAINMAYYNNNPEKYCLISNRDKLRLKRYMDNLSISNTNGGGLSLKELLDTNTFTLRIRCQMKDIGSFEVAQKVDSLKQKVDLIFNPDKAQIENYFSKIKTNKKYIDSILYSFPNVYNGITALYSKGNSNIQYKFDVDPNHIKRYYKKKDFTAKLRSAIDHEYYDIIFTGTSVVAAEGTFYLEKNLLLSISIAIVFTGILMSLLFRSWRMVGISIVTNLIPLIFTGGIMGYFGIPLKPSTLLVFSIVFGISLNDTIHFLAKYRFELKHQDWDYTKCVIVAIQESGLGMFYTSIVLFSGFSVFLFSQFGGTQALGMLISITLLVAMITNLIVLPSLLLTMAKFITSKSFKEPYFDAYKEDYDITWNDIKEENQ